MRKVDGEHAALELDARVNRKDTAASLLNHLRRAVETQRFFIWGMDEQGRTAFHGPDSKHPYTE